MALLKKSYKNYLEYTEHQKSKLDKEKEWIPGFDNQYFGILKERLFDDFVSCDIQKGNVLCLGSRLGGEVRAFIKLGCFAVGIDLNPGENNEHVLYGDFHKIPFPPKSADIVFSNSLDHSFDFDQFIFGIKKVLRNNGFLILEIAKGYEEGTITGPYESFHWAKTEDIIKIIENHGFKLIRRMDIEIPEEGSHCVFNLK